MRGEDPQQHAPAVPGAPVAQSLLDSLLDPLVQRFVPLLRQYQGTGLSVSLCRSSRVRSSRNQMLAAAADPFTSAAYVSSSQQRGHLLWFAGVHAGQREPERRALANLTLYADVSAVALNDGLANIQTQAQSHP